MKLNWILVIAGGLGSSMFGQQYPQPYSQQYPPNQGDANYNGQYGSDPYDRSQYSGDPNDAGGVYAPAPPPIPSYAYQRPPMPGSGYFWVDGYWNFVGGRYYWVGGYWTLPPYEGERWVAPRYSGGRFFLGFWGGGRRDFDRGFSRNDYRNQGRFQVPRSGSGFRGGDNRGTQSRNGGQRGGRR
jgi:hypothetical protein